MTTSAEEFAPVPPAEIEHPAAIPPAESAVLDCIARAHSQGHAALVSLAIAQDCPSQRSAYLARATEQLAHAADELAGACAAQALREMAGEADSDAGVAEAMQPPTPDPSIRCNACRDPENCAQCLALNAGRDAKFGAPARRADPAR